jgi:hypothetical protein
MRRFSTLVLFVVMALVGWSQADASGAPSDQGLEVGQTASIQGVARLEERHTIIPFICEPQAVDSCIQSKAYWSLVIYAANAHFEIDQRFAEGMDNAPESVELAGTTVTPGLTVKLEATVEYTGDVSGQNYYFVDQVRDVNIVTSEDSAEFSLPNWSCRGNVDANTELQANVWFGGGQTDGYDLRLMGAVEGNLGRNTYALAAFSNAQGAADQTAFIYRGASSNASADLTVDDSANSNHDVPGKLKYSLGLMPESYGRIPPQLELNVLCDKTR